MNWALLVIGGLLVGWFLPTRYIPSSLAALRRDPRLVASAAAILFILIDDDPRADYATLADPEACVMMSIIFGDSPALAVQCRWDETGKVFFAAASFLKLIGLRTFLVGRYEARVLYITFLLLTHALIAIAAFGDLGSADAAHRGRVNILEACAASAVIRGFFGILAVAVALAILLPHVDNLVSNRALSEYYILAAARALIPYLFWTTLLAYSWVLKRLLARA